MKDYPREFYDDLKDTALPSARRVVPLVRALMEVGSVVDVGCGTGGWLAAFRETGTADVLGLDGDWVRDDQLMIPRECFTRCALTERLPVDRRFDLAVSLEVAEHIPSDRGARFVAELTRLAPVVLFSAAIPDQGGLNHFNEQWPGYWAELFAEHGYAVIDTLRWQAWSDPDVTWWYKQNLLLFASAEALARHAKLAAARDASPPGAPLAVVHPEKFSAVARKARPGFGGWMRMGRGAVGRSLAKGRTAPAGRR
jgi:SAM-dependent methyltransferase